MLDVIICCHLTACNSHQHAAGGCFHNSPKPRGNHRINDKKKPLDCEWSADQRGI